MLVLGNNIVLSAEEAELPAGTPLILIDNKVTIANITTNSEDTFYPVTNLANPATNQEWRGADSSPSPTSFTIDVAINSVDLIDGVGIARHNLGTEGIAASIYAISPDATPTETLLVGPQIPANDEPLLFRFTERSFETLRVVLDAPGSVIPRAAVLYVGKLLVCERGFDINSEFTPPRFARKTVAVNGMSHAGDFLGRIVTSRSVADSPAIFKHFLPDWYRENFDPFINDAQTEKPFFFAWSPDSYPAEVGYMVLKEDPVPTVSPVTGRVSVSLRMDGILK